MSRQVVLLTALGAVLLIVAFWFLLYQPKNDELAQVQDETAAIEAQQAEVRQRITELEAVRDETPDLQAYLAAAESVIPRATALPSVLRQMQTAADDSGLTLVSVAPGRPTALEDDPNVVPDATAEDAEDVAPQDLSRLSVSVQIEGGYFQIVDFLRRIEDPSISPRAILWNSISVSEGPDEYPQLAASLAGDMYALVPPGGDEPVEPEPSPSPTDGASPGPSPSPTTGEG